MQQLPEGLQPLGQYRQFIGYRLVPDEERAGKVHKKPVNIASGHTHNPHDPAIWRSFDDVAEAVSRGICHGVGFVFTATDPFWFLDVDDCYGPDGWTETAKSLVSRLAGAAVEVSQSQSGLHIIGTGRVPPHGCDCKAIGSQFYTEARFVALTGYGVQGSVLYDTSEAIAAVVADYFPPGTGPEIVGDGPVPEWDGHEDDAALLEHACNTQSAASRFGSRASFQQLFEGDVEALAAAYPDSHRSRPYDESSADIALAQHLAFWTGKDGPRIERLMRLSGLARDKWDDRSDYLPRTIAIACGRTTEVHKRQRVERPESAVTEVVAPVSGPVQQRGELVTGYQLLSGSDQIEYFAGCVYVQKDDAILIPAGVLLNRGQFKAIYGGYDFVMDSEGRRVSRNAFEAFTESQCVRQPKVARTMFRPDLPPGEIFDYGGKSRVNNYVAIQTPRKVGDVSPFLNHLAKLLPDERDRDIALAYLAACVQHVGVKFQWCPLFQGVEGNGKTLLSRCVAEAVGMELTHVPKASEISAKFNSWIKDKVLIYVEDIYIPEAKRDVFEALKPIITNDWQPVEPKGVDESTEYVVANLILNSNHRNGIRKTRNDRRVAVFYTAQQTEADLAAWGMDGAYFPKLYDWLKHQDGYAMVAEFLATYAIPDELNPATQCHRAPKTSATEAAIAEGLGSVEQEILEAAAEGRPGFAGGWISSMFLDKLITELRAGRMIPHNRRRDMLRELGYDWHPGLRDGRVNNTVLPDSGKPRLFIREGHIHANLTTGAEIAAAYTKAQTEGPSKPELVFIDGTDNKG